MKVKELRDVLSDLKSIYEDAGARSAALEVVNLVNLLDGHDEEPIEDFMADIRALIVGTRFSARSRSAPLDEVAIDLYLTRLQQAGRNRSEFARVLSDIRLDPKVRSHEANAILLRYIVGHEAKRSKSAAIEAIEQRFDGRRLEENRLRSSESALTW